MKRLCSALFFVLYSICIFAEGDIPPETEIRPNIFEVAAYGTPQEFIDVLNTYFLWTHHEIARNTGAGDMTIPGMAAFHNNLEMMFLFIERGVFINHPINGQTPLDIAIEQGHAAMVQLLLKSGGTGVTQAARNADAMWVAEGQYRAAWSEVGGEPLPLMEIHSKLIESSRRWDAFEATAWGGFRRTGYAAAAVAAAAVVDKGVGGAGGGRT